MSWLDDGLKNAGNWLAMQIAGYLSTDRMKYMSGEQRYYEGNHPQQLKVKEGQANDNVSLNWLGLTVDRAVSLLIGGGVEFSFPEGSEAQAEYIDSVWNVNKRGIFLHDLTLDGAVFGTPYIKIIPDGIINPYNQKVSPRLVSLDPKLMTIEVDPRDAAKVEKYIMQFVVRRDGKEVPYKEVTRRATENDFDGDNRGTWIIEELEFINSRWQRINAVEFPYDFPPIAHCKNLPSLHNVYGTSDIEQVINAQNKYNFVQSNNLKINRYHAHPKTWGAGFTKTDKTSWGADEMITISAPDGRINNLEMSSDLTASRSIAQDLRQAIFDISRQVDLSSIQDKVGQLTNFGLRLLYSDAISKAQTKQELYGELFIEVNRRMLVMAGYENEKSFGGKVIFGESMPVNLAEEMEIDKLALDMQIVDRQTIYQRYADRYGMEWEDIQARMAEEKASEGTIGGLLLRNFNQGR